MRQHHLFENGDVAVYEGMADSDVTLKNCLFFGNAAGRCMG